MPPDVRTYAVYEDALHPDCRGWEWGATYDNFDAETRTTTSLRISGFLRGGNRKQAQALVREAKATLLRMLTL